MSGDNGWQITLAAREAWTRKADMLAVPCEGIRCAAVGGKIYCMGGSDTACYLYDPGRVTQILWIRNP
jgi:hypothetical protein